MEELQKSEIKKYKKEELIEKIIILKLQLKHLKIKIIT